MATTVNPAPSTKVTAPRTSWTTFAGVMFVIGGVANLLWAWAALADAATFGNTYPLVDSTFVGPLEFWGWVSVVWAVILFAGAALLFTQHELGRDVGVILAAVSAVFWLFAMPTFPLFALAVIAVDVLIIYGLIVHWEKQEL